jgi:hypothetical protein
MKTITLFLTACALAACGAEFEPGSRVVSPRILALQADKPYARPGEDVALTLLSANPDDEALEWAWGTCTLPPSSTVDDCVEALDGDLEPFDPETDTLSVSIASDLLEGVPAAQRPSALVGVVVVACPGELQTGSTDAVPTRCVDEDGNARSIHELEVGIKRIFVRESDRNANPVIGAITWDGEPWPEDEVQETALCTEDTFALDDCSEALQRRIKLEVSGGERGRDEFGGDFAEQVIVQFYSTHGLFRDQVRIGEDTDNRWVAQARDGGGDRATLWFIARDDRGGASWTTREVMLVR